MNAILEQNINAIQAQIEECNDKITELKEAEKNTKDAEKALTKIKALFDSNAVLTVKALNIVEELDNITFDSEFDDKITAEKDKIKKLNKALLALQEIDN